MGLRGPLQSKDSVRGMREAGRSTVSVIPAVLPDPPSWLNAEEKKVFRSLVDDAAVGGHVQRVDAIVFANIARLQNAMQRERHANTYARLMRTLLPWLMAAGFTAVGRARLGLAPPEKKKSVTSQLLEMSRRPAA